MSSVKLQIRIDPGDELRYFQSGDCPFEPEVLEVIGADVNGSLLASFGYQTICNVIWTKLGLAISPDMIDGFGNITWCGLYPLWIMEHGRVRRFRLWVLMTE